MSNHPQEPDITPSHRRLAWGLFAASVGMLLATAAFEAFGPRPHPGVEEFTVSAWAFSVGIVCFALVGALIATRVAGNPLGWYLIGSRDGGSITLRSR